MLSVTLYATHVENTIVQQDEPVLFLPLSSGAAFLQVLVQNAAILILRKSVFTIG